VAKARKDGRSAKYQAQVADHTGKIVTRGFDRREDYWEFVSMMRARRQRIRSGLEAPFHALKLGQFVSSWLVSRRLGKASSVSGDVTKLTNFWVPRLGDRLLHTITRTEIERLLDGLIVEGLSPAYRNRHRALLHKLWNDAIRSEPPHATTNPVTKIKLLSEKTKTRTRGALTQREHAFAYFEGYAKHGPQWRVLAAIMALAGARIDEAVVMKWGDFNLALMTVTFARIWEIKTKSIQERTKGQRDGGEEAVLLQPELHTILTQYRAQSTPQPGSQLRGLRFKGTALYLLAGLPNSRARGGSAPRSTQDNTARFPTLLRPLHEVPGLEWRRLKGAHAAHGFKGHRGLRPGGHAAFGREASETTQRWPMKKLGLSTREQGDHNPLVGGSSPSPAIYAKSFANTRQKEADFGPENQGSLSVLGSDQLSARWQSNANFRSCPAPSSNGRTRPFGGCDLGSIPRGATLQPNPLFLGRAA
jgi:integrase